MVEQAGTVIRRTRGQTARDAVAVRRVGGDTGAAALARRSGVRLPRLPRLPHRTGRRRAPMDPHRRGVRARDPAGRRQIPVSRAASARRALPRICGRWSSAARCSSSPRRTPRVRSAGTSAWTTSASSGCARTGRWLENTASSACSRRRRSRRTPSSIPILRRKLREIIQQEGGAAGIPRLQRHPADVQFDAEGGTLPRLRGGDPLRHRCGDDDLGCGRRSGDGAPGPARPRDPGNGHPPQDALLGAGAETAAGAALIEAYHGTLLNYHLALGQGDQARLHFYLAHDPDRTGPVDLDVVQTEVSARSSARGRSRLEDALIAAHGATRGHHLANRLARFSSGYQAAVDIETAAGDVTRLARLAETREAQLLLGTVRGGARRALRAAPVRRTGPIRAQRRDPDAGEPGVARPRFGSLFRRPERRRVRGGRRDAPGEDSDLRGRGASRHRLGISRRRRDRIADALRAIHAGRAEDDRLNELIVTAGLLVGGGLGPPLLRGLYLPRRCRGESYGRPVPAHPVPRDSRAASSKPSRRASTRPRATVRTRPAAVCGESSTAGWPRCAGSRTTARCGA